MRLIHAATEQFIPAGVAGALLTFVLFRFAPQSLWMLPGSGGRSYSASAFSRPAARCRARCSQQGSGISPPGSPSLAFANGAHAYSPWSMAVCPMAIGQLFIAAVLYWRVGESDVEV